MQLQDFDTELTGRGFDGLDPATRARYINFGYRTVARKFPEMWSDSEVSLPMGAGTYYFTMSPNASGGDINNVRTVDGVYVATDPYRRKLEPLTWDEFYRGWFQLDLAAAAQRGIPDNYWVDDDKLYITPPPSQTLTVRVKYRQQPGTLVLPTDTPITPIDLDEAILSATLVKLHTRVKEFLEADQYNNVLADQLDDALSNASLLMAEEQERVEPDDTWL